MVIGLPTKRARLDDVANAAGVSPSTVSLVLREMAGPSDATRERVKDAAVRLAYRPDRAASVLASRRSRLIGVVMDISNPFHAQLVQDLHGAARHRGYDLVLSTVTESQQEIAASETLLDSRCGALLLLGPMVSGHQLDALVKLVPVVIVGRPSPAVGVDVVRTDDAMGLRMAVAHLAGLGHQRITYVDGGVDAANPVRVSAYRAAMLEHGLVDGIEVVPGGDTEHAGAAAAAALLARSIIPTGIITFNDRSAFGLIDTLRRAGIDVPRTVSVIGYDDSPVARLGLVGLTTITQNTAELAAHAVDGVAQRLDKRRDRDNEIVVPPHLTIRNTTAAPSNP